MTAYKRVLEPGGTYFFTVVTHKRNPFLTKPEPRKYLREAIHSVRTRSPWTINAIVLLPDHLHTIWTLPPGNADYSTRWRQIKTLFTRSFTHQFSVGVRQSCSRDKKREQPVWQRRFYEHCCRDESDLKRCLDYLHFNPVKHGLVNHVREWKYSSFHRYVQMGEYDREWGKDSPLYGDEWLKFE